MVRAAPVDEHRQQQARQEKDTHEMQECTFKPAINNRSEFYARRTRGCYLEPLSERLHHEADKLAILRQKAKELLEADEMCAYSFRPNINRSRSSDDLRGDRTPLHLRAEKISKKRQENLRAAQAAEDVRSDCSFQPRISGRSERIVQKKRDEMYRALSQGDGQCLKMLGPVEDRLYAEAEVQNQKRLGKQDSISESSQPMPSVDDMSRKICKQSVYFQGPQQDFLTRQQTFELAKQRRLEVRAQHAEAKSSFRPHISDNSRQLVSNNVEYIGETPQDRDARLSKKDATRREQLRVALEQLHYRDCTFRPNINPGQQAGSRGDSSVLDSTSDSACTEPVHERLYKATPAKSRSVEDADAMECTFRPQIDTKAMRRFSHVRPHYQRDASNIMDNIKEELDKREENIAERRRELEEQERAMCPFTPGVSKPYDEPHRPVVVSGLGRFFELRQLAARQQQEQQEREAKAFCLEASTTRCGGVTIPEPFELSCNMRDESRRTRGSQRFDGEDTECTFHPQTNESAKKELLKEIMSMPPGAAW